MAEDSRWDFVGDSAFCIRNGSLPVEFEIWLLVVLRRQGHVVVDRGKGLGVAFSH
jgi:hypothetical protein